MKTTNELPTLGVVGPCTSGKSTLIRNLNGKFAVNLRHKAQEHSYVQSMWQRIHPPTWLVFLDVSYPVTNQRNQRLNWSLEEYQEQQRRLAHARANADVYLLTDDLTPEQVAEQVAAFLASVGVTPV
jgi:ABC-type cobalamin/Fe3+-siderophores transport system ATPase subunit